MLPVSCHNQSGPVAKAAPYKLNVAMREKASLWWGLRGRSSGRLFAASCYGRGLIRSSMRNTGAGIGKPSLLIFPGFPIVPPPFNVYSDRVIPRLISVGVCVSELLLGAQAIREFIKLHVGLYRGHAADQDDQNPFHRNTHLSAP